MDKGLDPARAEPQPLCHLIIGGQKTAIHRVQEGFQGFERGPLSLRGILLTEPVEGFGQERHRPTSIEHFFRCQ